MVFILPMYSLILRADMYRDKFYYPILGQISEFDKFIEKERLNLENCKRSYFGISI